MLRALLIEVKQQICALVPGWPMGASDCNLYFKGTTALTMTIKLVMFYTRMCW